MVVRAFVFEFRGGALLDEVEPATIQWSVTANTAETIEITVPMRASRRDWPNLATPWKHCLAVDVGGRVFGGPILPHDYSDDEAALKLTARGFRIALARRSVLPVAALTTSLLLADGSPNLTLDTAISGYDYGTIGKKLCQQAFAWPGWTDVPVIFPGDRAGTRESSYAALDRKNLDGALSDLSGLENGPDIRFQLEHDGSDAFLWTYQSGSEAQPRLEGPDVHALEIVDTSALRVVTDPSRMGSLAWSQGGRTSDEARVAMMYDPLLVDAGFPMLELETRASVNTVEQDTLDQWNAETLRTASGPWAFWSFQIRADRSPFPIDYNIGDLVDITVTAGSQDYVPARREPYRRRIVGLAGDERGDWIKVTCGEVYEG
jgi:hypothetical protein